jgi:hypothetical protein
MLILCADREDESLCADLRFPANPVYAARQSAGEPAFVGNGGQ